MTEGSCPSSIQLLTHVRLFVTPWTALIQFASYLLFFLFIVFCLNHGSLFFYKNHHFHKSEISVTFAQSCLTLWSPIDCSLPGSSNPWDFLAKSTGVGCHFLLQGIFPTQGSHPSLPHCRQMLYCLSHQGSPSVTSKMSKIHLGGINILVHVHAHTHTHTHTHIYIYS